MSNEQMERDAYIIAVARQIGDVYSELEVLFEKRDRLVKELKSIINQKGPTCQTKSETTAAT